MEGNVLIIGLGLIGGSVALAIKKEHPECIISGYDLNPDSMKLAHMLQVIDEGVEDDQHLLRTAKNADLIILATPVQQSEQWIEKIALWQLKNEAIVTDVGSTKQKIMEKARLLKKQNITFIGGHPMAGSHKSGVQAAKALLFENAFYLLTPYEGENEIQVETLQHWLKGTRAKFLVLSAKEHDELTGVVSHLPHIVAASLVRQALNSKGNQDLLQRLAAGGFRDITRIASSNPYMWRDILIHNKEVLLDMLHQWKEEIELVTKMIEEEAEEEILQYFQTAKDYRDNLPTKAKGAIPAFYDLYVDLPDYPGVISEITGLLAKESINIINIQILETREDLFGVLVISFQTYEDRLRAKACINDNTSYETFIPA
ncbi:MAG TPA: prephenate dehydrogenase [Bacillus sp. (in: firmicutes)]|nr:prephenate dehydrogenase [Bacillus sp. (in: firmicutes)]